MDTGCSEERARPFAGLLPLIAVMCIARGLAFAARTHVVPFYPELMEKMGVGYTASGMIYSAYMLAYAVALAPSGALSDRYSPRRMMGWGFGLMAAGTFGLAYTTWFWLALVLRMIQGVGTALVYSATLKLVVVRIPRSSRARVLSAIEVMIGAGMLITLTIFPVLSTRVSLSTLFVSLGVMLLGGLLLLPFFPAEAMAPPVAGAIIPERRPGSYKDVMGRPVYLLMTIAFLGLFVTNGFFGWLPTYFAKEIGLGKSQSGILMAVLLISEMMAAPFAGLAADRWNRRLPVLQIGSIALAAACLVALPAASGFMPYVVAIFAGASIGWSISPLGALAAESHGPERAGLVSSLTSAAGQVGGMIAGVTFGFVVDRTGSFRYVWMVGLVLALVRVVVATRFKEMIPEPLIPVSLKKEAIRQ